MNRKFILTITFCFCGIIQMMSQETSAISSTEKYKQFGLVWGLMKYHHSEVSKGKYNWDAIFIENIDKLEGLDTQEKLNEFLFNFIFTIKLSKIKIAHNEDGLFKKNQDYDWIEKYSANEKLYNYLTQLKENTSISDYYVSNQSLTKIPTFENEKGFKAFDYKIKSHRLLELFSFWNAIQYHYVNKYLMNKNWFGQLDHFVEDFAKSTTQFGYERAKNKLNAALNDSHTEFTSKTIYDSLFKYKPPFRVKLVNDTLVITGIFNKELGEKDDLKLGDLIVEVRDQNIKSILKEKVAPMLSFSNDSYLKRFAGWVLFNNEGDSVKVKVKRNDAVITKYLHFYTNLKVKDPSWLKSFFVEKKWQFVEEKIGYINLKDISKEELQKAFEEFSNTDGIILDLRKNIKNSSNNDITKYTYPDKKKFIKVLTAIPNRPSLANFDDPLISIIANPFKSGSKNSKYYNKSIILLVDNTTQSRGEFTGMAIQASPNCITVGEATSGAVMNVAVFTMPDGTKTSFTSMGAFYPDGTGVQRKGLKIDHYVNETTSNFTEDQYILKGIELIKSTKK